MINLLASVSDVCRQRLAVDWFVLDWMELFCDVLFCFVVARTNEFLESGCMWQGLPFSPQDLFLKPLAGTLNSC